MPLGHAGSNAATLFQAGAFGVHTSAVFSALAMLLMVADVRWKVTQPLARWWATLLQPVQQAAAGAGANLVERPDTTFPAWTRRGLCMRARNVSGDRPRPSA
jgi:hypothetical protein